MTMETGKFIQAGATPPGTAADGYGEFVTVGRLEALDRSNVRKRMDNAQPELFAEGVRILRAKLDAEADAEKLRQKLFAIVGGNGVLVALAMMTEEAAKQAVVDATKARAQAMQPKK